MKSKNNENIYGYTGKKTPNFNFVSLSANNPIKKQIDLKPKPVVIKNDKSELFIKTLFLKTTIDDPISFNFKGENLEFDKEIKNISDIILHDIKILINDEVFYFQLLPHEKGLSIKINTYNLIPIISIDGDKETITFSQEREDRTLKVYESKINFERTDFPFYYIYEVNDKYDGIFHDFIQSNLPEIRPPTQYTVPAKQTNNEISYRQYISYIKTNTILNFKVDQTGWFLDSFSQTDEDLPNGVEIMPKYFWIYHPRCQRIEHQIRF